MWQSLSALTSDYPIRRKADIHSTSMNAAAAVSHLICERYRSSLRATQSAAHSITVFVRASVIDRIDSTIHALPPVVAG